MIDRITELSMILTGAKDALDLNARYVDSLSNWGILGYLFSNKIGSVEIEPYDELNHFLVSIENDDIVLNEDLVKYFM